MTELISEGARRFKQTPKIPFKTLYAVHFTSRSRSMQTVLLTRERFT